MRKIRVVVIDDSAYNRRAITRMLESLPEIEVAGYAVDGEEGIRAILDLKPDLVTLDIEMPKMDGFTLLRIIMSRCPTPVIVVSSKGGDDRVFKAMELGALDFIVKPTTGISDELLNIRESLHEKVRSVLKLNMAGIRMRESLIAEGMFAGKKKRVPPLPDTSRATGIRLIAIGSSTGGPPALQSIFSSFNEKPPFSVVVSQHMPPGFTRTFAERLNRLSVFDIKEAGNGDLLEPGKVLVAPGGRNMIFHALADQVAVRIVDPEPGENYIPSVDRMFSSCSEIFGPHLLGIVLTGMGNDGARGVRAIKAAGGQVLAESEDSAVIFGMPREAIATGAVDKVISLDRIADEIMMRCGIYS
ncbi:MAG: response regulator receiver modulated CheB methylesterase [Geobacteraceae bacterium]|nr:response regulator receiver modulated CheB methylesterase [Geobacteraceae bacterium]